MNEAGVVQARIPNTNKAPWHETSLGHSLPRALKELADCGLSLVVPSAQYLDAVATQYVEPFKTLTHSLS